MTIGKIGSLGAARRMAGMTPRRGTVGWRGAEKGVSCRIVPGCGLARRSTIVFDLDQFIADCRAALAEDASHKTVREVVARAVVDPGAVLGALGEPQRGGVHKLYHGGDLTILNVIWPPFMTIMPHNHLMWAVIGVYTGREDNIFWRRLPERAGGKVEAAAAKALGVKDAEPLGRDIIHSVSN